MIFFLFFSLQETCNKQAGIDLGRIKTPPDIGFLTWNWPLIRKSCFWSVMSVMIACLCIVVGMIATVPRRCYPFHQWYQGSVFYEIFPASFQDSNADGIGDLRGIAMRADYFTRLGVRAIRLNSIFPSTPYPENFDKVKNLTEIEKSLGTLNDFNYLLDVMHRRNISVILDFPLHPYVKDLGELNVVINRKNNRKDVADKITNVVHNHRSHRSVENETEESVDVPELIRTEFNGRVKLLKPYIDGGIAGLMKYTSEHLNSISQTLVEEALYFWFRLGVDGVYLKGLENYINDIKFSAELKKWKEIKENFYYEGESKMLMCNYRVLDSAEDAGTKNLILTTMDLLDVYLDLSNGTTSAKNTINKYQDIDIFNRPDYSWIHWNIGNENTTRLASKVSNHLGAILFQYLLPGTISIFYGDEIGLLRARDSHQDHGDVKHIHQLAPMNWLKNGTGFTQATHLPWLPYAEGDKRTELTEIIISNLTRLRMDTPSIYMNSVWKEKEHLQNFAFRNKDPDNEDSNILILERSYPRRNAYVVIFNAGKTNVRKDYSSIYYGGELIEDANGNNGIYMTFDDLILNSGDAYVVKLHK